MKATILFRWVFYRYLIHLLSGGLLWSSCASNPYPCHFGLPAELEEVSGLYLQSKDSLWWHNDGGWPAELHLTNARGKLLASRSLPAALNRDWEELTADDQGNIFIGDFGNNLNKRKDLRIYIFSPTTGKLDSILFDYPDQHTFPPAPALRNFDMEAMCWHEGELHLFSKNTLDGGSFYSKHYILPARAGNQTAVLRDSFFLKNRVVTAAAIGPDGQTVALLAYRYRRLLGLFPWSAASIFLLPAAPSQPLSSIKIFKQRAPSFIIATQFESIDFLDDRHLYVASERTAFIRQKAKRVRIKKRFFKARKQIGP